MSDIDGQFFAESVRRWHRHDLSEADAESLVRILRPIDDTAQELANQVDFDGEPSDFQRIMAVLTERSRS